MTEANLNLKGPPTAFRPEDGRPIFGGFAGDPHFGSIILLTNTHRGYS